MLFRSTLELVRDGALRELSIGFREVQNRRLPTGIIERVKADLHEVAVVMEGAYGELAVATGVRAAASDRPLLAKARTMFEALPDLPPLV